MGKLADIVFQTVTSKEFDVKGHKIKLRSLTTKDNLELEIGSGDKIENTNQILKFALKILSRSIVAIDDVVPENEKEVVEFLGNQHPDIVFEIFENYQKINENLGEEIKK